MPEQSGNFLDAILQQFIISLHFAAVIGFGIEQITKLLIGFALAQTQAAKDFENLLCMRVIAAHPAVVININQKIGLQRIDLLIAGGLALLAQAEDYAGLNE